MAKKAGCAAGVDARPELRRRLPHRRVRPIPHYRPAPPAGRPAALTSFSAIGITGRAVHGPSGTARERSQPETIPTTRLITVARMLVPKTYDSRQCRSATARIVELDTLVSETW